MEKVIGIFKKKSPEYKRTPRRTYLKRSSKENESKEAEKRVRVCIRLLFIYLFAFFLRKAAFSILFL